MNPYRFPHRHTLVWILVLSLGVLLAGQTLAGFRARVDGKLKYNGKKITQQSRKDNVKNAIQKLKDTMDSAPDGCAEGLEKLRKKSRGICKETGAAKDKPGWHGATKTDGKPGAGADRINVDPEDLDGDTDILACVLAHEWVHVNETGAGEGEKEKEEKEVEENQPTEDDRNGRLTVGASSMGPTSARDLLSPVVIQPAPVPALAQGYASLRSGDAKYFVGEHGNQMLSYLVSAGVAHHFGLGLIEPLNLAWLESVSGPTGGRVLVASGVTSSGSGALQYLEVDTTTGTVTQSLLQVPLPGVRPLDLDHEVFAGLDLLYVLDVTQKRILLFWDSNGDRLPESVLAQPWATSATYPQLQGAKALFRDLSAPLTLMVSPRDLRIQHNPKLSAAVWELGDVNADGRADYLIPWVEADLLVFDPEPYAPPLGGDTDLEAMAVKGATIELWQSDAGSALITLLGTAVTGADNNVSFSVATPFVTGRYLLLRDVSTPGLDPPEAFLVE